MSSTVLDGQVTRPESFDAGKDYALVVARGDQWLADFDVNDAQRILRGDLAALHRQLFIEGAILAEGGGTIGQPIPGVNLGQDVLGAAGAYVGIETQLYTVRITAGGGPGTARFTWQASGGDTLEFPTVDFPVTAIAPDLETALADLDTYGHVVGRLGVLVVFVNELGFVTGGNSWVVPATYGARPPVVEGSTITVSDLVVSVAGKLHRVRGAALAFPPLGAGISTVYGEWTRTLVTHVDDTDLRDRLSATPSAWRERWRLTLQTADTSELPVGGNLLERRVFPLYRWDRATDVVTRVVRRPLAIDLQLTQGYLEAERLLNVDQNVLLQGLLARIDGGAHGSYVVDPLPPRARAWRSTNPAPPGKLLLAVPPISASVEGVQVRRPAPSEIEVDEADSVGVVTDEPHLNFQPGHGPYLLNKAAGSPKFPIAGVTALRADVQVGVLGTGGYEPVVRGAGATDNLAHTPVLSIARLSNAQGGAATWASPADYSLVGNQVSWVPGQGPGPGTTFYAVYVYHKVMIETVDFLLTVDGGIDFDSAPGDKPVTGSTFDSDYTYFLPRTDALILRPTGDLAVVKGIGAEAPELPQIPRFTLAYARVEIPPNSAAVRIRRFNNDRVTFERINDLIDRLDAFLRDNARQDLLNQARASIAASTGTFGASANFEDILAEAFATTELADLGYDAGGITFDATLDTEAAELTLPFAQTISALARINPPVGETDVHVHLSVFTLPFDHELAIDAPKYSFDYSVNPYADFRAEPPVALLSPSQDVWEDTTSLSSTRTRVVQNGAHENYRIVGTTTEVVTRTSEVAERFMRQIRVDLTGLHFVPGERVRLRFDGKDIPLTADLGTTQGPDIYTVIAQASDAQHVYGDLTAHFIVPANVPSGTVAVELFGDAGAVGSAWPGSYTRRWAGQYTSVGTRREVATETIVTIIQNDPIAQSLLFPSPRMISKLDIPMAQKPAAPAARLVVELRRTDRSGRASTPIDEALGRFTKEAVDVAVGPGSSNLFLLPEPILCPANEFRSLVLRSASNGYRAYVAEVGGPDRTAGGFISSQQIPDGIFMDSANNTDWTLHQGWDLRCKVWVAKMTALEARCYFNRLVAANLTAFFLAVDQVLPDGTSIEWQYSTDGLANGAGGKVWTRFEPFTVTELTAVAATLDVRAILRTTDPYVTPAIYRKTANIVLQANATDGTYVSSQKTASDAGGAAHNVTAIQGGVELLSPASTTQDVFVTTDGGTTWDAVDLGGGDLLRATQLANGFTRYEFEKTGLTAGNRLRLRIDQHTTNRAIRPRAARAYLYASEYA